MVARHGCAGTRPRQLALGLGPGPGQPRVSGCDARVSLTCPACLSVSDCPQPPAALRPCPCGPLLSQACLSSLVLVSVCGASFTLSGPGALGWMPAALRQGDTLVGCYEQEHPSTSLEPRGSRLELGVFAPQSSGSPPPALSGPQALLHRTEATGHVWLLKFSLKQNR